MHPAKVRGLAIASCAVIVYAGGHASLSGNGSTTTLVPKIQVIEWTLPSQGDFRPGAVAIDLFGDGNRLWFVTRDGAHVYRMDFRGGKKVSKAQWVSYELDPANTGVANGLRRVKTSGDKRFVFVDSTVSVQRVDTVNCTTKYLPSYMVTCPRTRWDYIATEPADPTVINPSHGSDVAIDEYNNVYTAVAAADPADLVTPLPGGSFVQRLNPSANYENVTRWYVGNNAGFCPTSLETPCLSGVAIDRRNRDLVYYSEPGTFDFATLQPINRGAIAELDTRYNRVRRWTMEELAKKTGDATIFEPRQLHFDNDGTVWAITGSGHLVSLDPKKNKMSKHLMPPEAIADPFGISPDGGLIGYTDPGQVQPRVGMLMPARRFVFVGPVNAPIYPKKYTVPGITADAVTATGAATPVPTTVPGRIEQNGDGTFSEAFTSGFAQSPLGITPDHSSSQGTFFFAVGDFNVINRIARVRLPRGDMRGRNERDDDDGDDDGKRHDADDDDDDDGSKDAHDADSDNDGSVDAMDGDDDNDGIPDDFDTKDRKEYQQTSQQDLPAGQAGDDPFTINPSTLLVVASATAPDPLTKVKVEVIDAAGNVVAASLEMPGTAAVTFVPPPAGGNYTLRAKNLGLGSQSISTKILTRELWPLGL